MPMLTSSIDLDAVVIPAAVDGGRGLHRGGATRRRNRPCRSGSRRRARTPSLCAARCAAMALKSASNTAVTCGATVTECVRCSAMRRAHGIVRHARDAAARRFRAARDLGLDVLARQPRAADRHVARRSSPCSRPASGGCRAAVALLAARSAARGASPCGSAGALRHRLVDGCGRAFARCGRAPRRARPRAVLDQDLRRARRPPVAAISTATLSVSSSTTGSSARTASPTFFSHVLTTALVPSCSVGTTMSVIDQNPISSSILARMSSTDGSAHSISAGLCGLGMSGIVRRDTGASRSRKASSRHHRGDLRAEAGAASDPHARSGSGACA